MTQKFNTIATESIVAGQGNTTPAYKEITIIAGGLFSNAQISNNGVVFKDTPQNEFDKGIRNAKFGEFDVTEVVDRSKENASAQTKDISGFQVKIGTIVNIQIRKNFTVKIPIRLILQTETQQGGTDESKSSTVKKIVITILIASGIYGLLKLTKVI